MNVLVGHDLFKKKKNYKMIRKEKQNLYSLADYILSQIIKLLLYKTI